MAILSLDIFKNRLAARLLSLCLCLGALEFEGSAATRRRSEPELKAAYLYNFALFSTWPDHAFRSADAPFVIAILGDDPVTEEIRKIAEVEKARKRRIMVLHVEPGGMVPECHMLYVSASEKDRLEAILQTVQKRPTLTVSDINPFCRLGGCVRFKRTDHKIRLIVNPTAAAEAGLRISPDLLAIAEIQTTEKPSAP